MDCLNSRAKRGFAVKVALNWYGGILIHRATSYFCTFAHLLQIAPSQIHGYFTIY